MPPRTSSAAPWPKRNASAASDARSAPLNRSAAAPLSAAEFAAAMDRIADGLPRGGLAAGISGGADSMALALLLDRWCRTEGRSFTALVVDHGLRAESASEAAMVADWLAGRGIVAEVLRWSGDKPTAGIQQAARAARLGLMTAWCGAQGVPALLLAHHRMDQVETVLMRLDRDSGLDGLAGIRPLRWHGGIALIRPLLDIDPARLRATCLAFGQPWVDDPSNLDVRFARVRFRQAGPALAAAGLDEGTVLRLAGALDRLASWTERQLAAFIAEHGRLAAAGYAAVDRSAFAALPEPLGRRLLRDLLRCVGGRDHPSRGDRLDRLYGALARDDARPATLAGCRIWNREGDLWFAREPSRSPPVCTLRPGGSLLWDGRFEARWRGELPVRIAMLGEAGWRRWRRGASPSGRESDLPHAVRLTLPAAVDLDGGLFVPHLSTDNPREWSISGGILELRFRPTVAWLRQIWPESGDDRAGWTV